MAPKKKATPAAAVKATPAADVATDATNDKKRKVDEPAAEEPPRKEVKTTVPKVPKSKDAEVQEEAEEDNVEREKDDKPDKRPVIKHGVSFLPQDTTLNVVATCGGKVLMALSDGGMQYLISSARADVGMKSGRYYYETRVIEALNPQDAPMRGGRPPMPRQLVRLGFSVAGSSLYLGDSEDGVCFDSEGFYCASKKRVQTSQKFTREQVLGVMLNLDPTSPNKNTMSLFRDGDRISEPQAIPEHLVGKTFYPHVVFRNVTLHMNFGPVPLTNLPFKCRTLGAAAAPDIERSVSTKPPKDGKYEVVFPVGVPDEGTFDWLDTFLEKNPGYTELSDRMILDWASRSNLFRIKGYAQRASNDKPDMGFGIPAMDDFSVQRVIKSIVAVVPRNYVVMEIKSNLMEADRKEALEIFSQPHYKKTAVVVVGEPAEDFKEKVHKDILKLKQDKADAEYNALVAEQERKKAMALRQKQLDDARKKFEEQRKKLAEEQRKKVEEMKKKQAEEKKAKEDALKKAAAEAAGETVEEGDTMEDVKDEEEVKAEEDAKAEGEEAAKDDVKMEEAKEEETKEEEEEPIEKIVAELTDDEKKVTFRPVQIPDLAPPVLHSSYAKFTIPSEDEGFDAVRYEWLGESEAQEYLQKWVLKMKLMTPINELAPSEWFKERLAKWQKGLQEWHEKLTAFKKSPENKKAQEEKKSGEEGGAEAMAEDLDIFSVDNVCDVGNGEPLFVNFVFEDWALLSLRFEMYLLAHAFKKDVDDPDRPGMHESLLTFYYNKYFKKAITPKLYGLTTHVELVDLVKDTVKVNESGIIESHLDGEMDTFDQFVKLAEECRRERQRRLDAGDETVRLKFTKPVAGQIGQNPVLGSLAPRPMGMMPGVRPGGFVRPAGMMGSAQQWPRPGQAQPGAVGSAGAQPWRPSGPTAWRG